MSSDDVNQQLNGPQEEEDDLVGTDHYISPEMIQNKKCSFTGDLWALGIIIY